MQKRVISLMVVIAFMITSLFSGVVFATVDENSFYTKIQSFSTEEKAALVGIFWTYVAGYNGGSAGSTDQIVNDIQNDLIAIGLNQKFIDKGITEELLRSTIDNIKDNPDVVKAAIDIQKLTSNTALNSALSALVDEGIISGSIKDLASSNMIAMLDAFAAINKPILTKDSNGLIIVKDANLSLLVDLVNIFIQDSGTSADQYKKLAGDIAAAINGISDPGQKSNMIKVLESFKIYEAPANTGNTGGSVGGGGAPGGGTSPTPTPTPAPAPDTANKGQETLNNAVQNESQITSEIANKVSEAVKTIISAAPKNEDEAGKVSKAISDASENLLQAIGKAVNDAVRNQIAKDTANLVAAIAGNLSVVQTESKTIEVINNASAALANAGSVAKAVNDETSRAALYDKTTSVVGQIGKAMDIIADPQKAVEIAQKLITDATKILGFAQDVKASVKEEAISKELAKIADKAIEKLGKEVVSGQYSGSTLKSVVSDAQATSLTSKIEEVIKTAGTMESKLQDGLKVEKKVTIEIPKDSSAKEVQVQLPSSLLNTASAKNLDKVEVNTGLASIAITPNAFSTADTKNVALTVKNVDKNTELSAELKTKVGDAPVYDFNLTVSRNSGTEEKVSKFSSPVVVKVPYTPGNGENTDKVSVFFINDKGELENMVGKYDASTGTVSFTTSHFSKYVVKVSEVGFYDLSNYAWAEKQIEVMAAKGAIGGMAPSIYDPSANITRAQFASIIVKALGLYDENAKADFIDVAAGNWYYSAVASAVKAGIIAGYPDKTFKPDANITRQDMAVMAANAMTRYKGAVAPQNIENALEFADATTIANYAKTGAAVATKYDIITGMPGKQFAPKENANRAQAAVIIYKIFNLQ